MPDASPEDYDGFQTQFTHIMETILHNAVREATKLYEGTLHRLKAELVQLRQDNVNTNTGDSSSKDTKRFPESGNQRIANVPKHRDIGVQCDKPILVDRECSPLPFIGQCVSVGDISSDKLTDLCANEDGSRQLALLLIKQEPKETECDSYAPGYFLLKQEGAEPILVRREPNKDTMERVMIPPSFQTITRHHSDIRGKSPPAVIPSSCSRRVDSCGHKPNQTIQPIRGTSEKTLENSEGLSSQNKRQNVSAPAQTPTTSVLANSTQTPAPTVNLSVPMIELSGAPSIPQAKSTASSVHRRPNPNPQTSNQTVVPQKEESNICHPLQNTFLSPVSPSQVLVTEPHSSKQWPQALVTNTEKSISTIALLNQATEPLIQSQFMQSAFFPPQTIKTPDQEVTPQLHAAIPSGHVSITPNIPSAVQDRILSTSLVPPQKVFASPQVIPAHSVTSSPSFQFPLVLPHNPTQPTPPSYLPKHVPFTSPHLPVNTVQGSVSINPPQPLLKHTQYPTQSNQFSSSDQMFPPPDNTAGVLESLDTLHLHSSIVMTPQEAPEQTPMHHFQPSGQLAPLLTLKEQQAAASTSANVVLGRVPVLSSETSVSPVDDFEGDIPLSPCFSAETTDRNDKDLSEDDDTPTLQSRLRKQRKIFSKSRQIDPAGEDGTVMVNDKRVDWVQTSHSGSNNESQTFSKSLSKTLQKNTECPECGRVLSNASALENHMRLHTGERPYTCSQCGKAFPSVRGLNRHVKVHAEEKRYQCEECGKSFVYHFTLTKHQLIHSGERPFPCKVCGKRFLAKADRSTHMRMHTGEKPFSCTLCGKKFKHRVALNMHMQGHRGEKRYICPHCEKGFVDLGNFKRHKLIHTGERPFECKQCGKRFTQSAHLKKHVNTQHVS
ncbi:Zinc finger protein 554 [Anabarilius grahami]|uniref:Zinc finger protein 554 n=1 Tax=Anabarilius grahami TaxID=495550 RepID=A0A3N0XJW2_ANAGA|nr:Zinc finger protein 554 [Anabarilius grahami]